MRNLAGRAWLGTVYRRRAYEGAAPSQLLFSGAVELEGGRRQVKEASNIRRGGRRQVRSACVN